jgi:ribosomal protein S27AE
VALTDEPVTQSYPSTRRQCPDCGNGLVAADDMAGYLCGARGCDWTAAHVAAHGDAKVLRSTVATGLLRTAVVVEIGTNDMVVAQFAVDAWDHAVAAGGPVRLGQDVWLGSLRKDLWLYDSQVWSRVALDLRPARFVSAVANRRDSDARRR